MGAKILIYYRLTIKWDDWRIEWVGHYSQSPFGIHPFNCISSRCTNLIRAYVGISTFKFSFLSSHSKRESKTMFKLLNATWRYADIRPHEKSIKMLIAPKCAKRWDAIIWMNAELELINATTARKQTSMLKLVTTRTQSKSWSERPTDRQTDSISFFRVTIGWADREPANVPLYSHVNTAETWS